jgi:type VI secretion system protein ImpJ
MKYLSRVVWSEGMHLSPHHFQVQSRYFEDSIQFATSALWFACYGLIDCKLDDEALANGTLSLIHARGVMPDGLPFYMPDSDPVPAVRQLEDHFPPARESITAMLAVLPRGDESRNTAPAGEQAGDVRYLSEARPTYDDNSGRDEKPVQFGRKNLRLLFDTEPNDEFVTLPLARITRDSSGRYVFDKAFIPPCVRIGASEHLMDLLRRLVEILDEKSAALSPSATRPDLAKSWAEYSTRDIANFWFLHTVQEALATLRHQYFSKQGHPEELFKEMSRLGGALCTFAIDSHPSSLPLYDHKRLTECFAALDEHIRIHLETIVPSNCVSIPLEKTADYFYSGKIKDTRCLRNARWVFAIRSPIGEVETIARTPLLVKFCSKAFVGELVKRAVPGLPLKHLPVPPSAISARLDTQYFGVTTTGPCWDHILKTHEVGVYVPGELPEPGLELLIVLSS